jgi:hypothetical protein
VRPAAGEEGGGDQAELSDLLAGRRHPARRADQRQIEGRGGYPRQAPEHDLLRGKVDENCRRRMGERENDCAAAHTREAALECI